MKMLVTKPTIVGERCYRRFLASIAIDPPDHEQGFERAICDPSWGFADAP